MHITQLSAANVKGRAFDDPLRPLTIWYGDNARGKTARLIAAQIALIGYCPKIGMQASSTFSLASTLGTALSVCVKMNDGTVGSRSFEKIGSSIKQTKTALPFEIPTLLIDQSEFLRLSADKRIAYVSSMCPSSAVASIGKLTAEIKNLSFEPNTDTTQHLLGLAIKKIGQPAKDASFQDWLDEQIVVVTEEIKLQKQHVDRMSKSIQALVLTTAPTPIDLLTLESDRKRVQTRLDEIGAELARYEERLNVYNETRRQIETMSQERMAIAVANPCSEPDLAAVREEYGRLSMEASALTTLLDQLKQQKNSAITQQKRLADTRAKLAAIDAALETLPALAEQRGKAVEQCFDYTSQTMGYVSAQVSIESRLVTVRQTFTALAADLQHVNAKYSAILENGTCPTCGHSGMDLKKQVTALRDAELASIQNKRNEYETVIQQLTFEIAELGKKIKASKELDRTMATAQAEADRLAKEMAALAARKNERNSLSALLISEFTLPESFDKGIAEIEIKLRSAVLLQSDAKQRQDAMAKTMADVQRKESLSARINDLVFSLSAPDPVDTIISEQSVLRETAANLDLSIKRSVGERQNEINRKRAERDLDMAKEGVGVYKAVLDVLKRYRGELVTTIFTPLLTAANRIFKAVLGYALDYQNGLIGYWLDGRFVSYELFSGTEEVIAEVSLSLALASQCPFKIVVFDELGRLHATRKSLLIETILQLINEKIIDQFIGVDVDDSPYAPWRGHESVALIEVS